MECTNVCPFYLFWLQNLSGDESFSWRILPYLSSGTLQKHQKAAFVLHFQLESCSVWTTTGHHKLFIAGFCWAKQKSINSFFIYC